ncbi:phage major capsid protein [Aerococcaceae bacterium DSM 111022]|nr:phage major capsid protein [Aerococcaceae bacterium DSM 111022]
MALKQLILSKKIQAKRSELDTVLSEIEPLNDKKTELEQAIEEAETTEEVTAVEESSEELQKDLDDKQAEIDSLNEEIAELENQLEAINNKKDEPKEGEKRNMLKGKEKEQELRGGISAYIRAKGDWNSLSSETRAQFTTVEGGALIPEEVHPIKDTSDEIFDLTKYINVVKVNRASGKYPIYKHSNGVMVTVEELAKNPELAVPTFDDVTFDVSTYRGYIPVSQEVIDDADFDVTGLIAEEIELQEIRTKNNQVIAAFKAMPAKTVSGLDEIKTMFNTSISKKFSNVKAFVSASLYNELDLMKDTEGRYLLQPSVISPTGKVLFGKDVIVIDDDVIGSAEGDLVGFFGDSKAAITLFDRKKNSVKWVDHDIYGQLLAGFTRFSVNIVDTGAGFYVTYTPPVAGA